MPPTKRRPTRVTLSSTFTVVANNCAFCKRRFAVLEVLAAEKDRPEGNILVPESWASRFVEKCPFCSGPIQQPSQA